MVSGSRESFSDGGNMNRLLACTGAMLIGVVTANTAVAAPPSAPLSTSQPAVSLDAKQRAALEKINAYFNSVSALTGKFVQIGPDGSKTEGQFFMLKPGKIRFEYDPPTPIELISDGDAVAVRNSKLATQDIYPLSQTPLRFLLSDKLDLLKDSNVTNVFGDDLFMTVVIEEKTIAVGTHKLMIMFGAKDYQLKQWTVTDPQGYDTTVAVSNLDSSKRPDPKLFKINYDRTLQLQ
jgi:outer membrane lipoprotein-sorting protein